MSRYVEIESEVIEDDGFLKRETVNVKVKLKRCPFCGGKAIIQHEAGEDGNVLIRAECQDCGCRTKGCETYDEAAESWNKRVNDES